MTTLYRRPLPEGLVAFSSQDGRTLFREALLAGTMEGFFPLIEQFHTQSEPAFCGLGTLVIVLNALAIDPGRAWRGPWRWFGEELLDCCQSLEVIREKGITMAQLVCLAKCNGANALARRVGEDGGTLDAFREAVAGAARTPGDPHLVVAYTRKALGQTGDGHYSPIAGYHEGRDLALLLDVARFKYPPHWVSVTQLWDAMAHHDSATGRPRGFIELRRGEHPPVAELLNDARAVLPDELRERLEDMATYCLSEVQATTPEPDRPA